MYYVGQYYSAPHLLGYINMFIRNEKIFDIALLLWFSFSVIFFFYTPKISDNTYIIFFIEAVLPDYGIAAFLIYKIPYLRAGYKQSFGRLRRPYELRGYCFIRIAFAIFLANSACILFIYIHGYFFYDLYKQWDWWDGTSFLDRLHPYVLIWIAYPIIVSFEEIIYRGAIRNILERYTNNTVTITIITAILFAIPHYYQGIGGLFFTFFLGIVLMTLYYKTNSLIPPIIAHYGHNLWAFWS